MLDQPSREVLIKVASTSLVKIGFMRWGREVTGALPSGTDISTGIKEQDPKVRLRGAEHIEKFTEHITQLHDGWGGPSRVMYVKRNLLQVWRQPGPDGQERRTLVLVQSFL